MQDNEATILLRYRNELMKNIFGMHICFCAFFCCFRDSRENCPMFSPLVTVFAQCEVVKKINVLIKIEISVCAQQKDVQGEFDKAARNASHVHAHAFHDYFIHSLGRNVILNHIKLTRCTAQCKRLPQMFN